MHFKMESTFYSFHLPGTQFGDQLQVVGAQQLHGVEEDGFEAEHREDGVGGVEVDVGEDIRHDVVHNVLQPGNAVKEERHALGSDALEEPRHDDGVQVSGMVGKRQ